MALTEKVMCEDVQEKEELMTIRQAIRDVRNLVGKGKIFINVTPKGIEVESAMGKKYNYTG